MIDDAGYLYLSLREYRAGPSGPAPTTYRVLSPQGEYLGLTTHPAGSGAGIMGGRLLINGSDMETGYYAYSVYEIRSAIPGFAYP
jgi:hypothetical protein